MKYAIAMYQAGLQVEADSCACLCKSRFAKDAWFRYPDTEDRASIRLLSLLKVLPSSFAQPKILERPVSLLTTDYLSAQTSAFGCCLQASRYFLSHARKVSYSCQLERAGSLSICSIRSIPRVRGAIKSFAVWISLQSFGFHTYL